MNIATRWTEAGAVSHKQPERGCLSLRGRRRCAPDTRIFRAKPSYREVSFIAKFTKQAICASFRKFLEQKPLEQITVKDIVDDCEINRKTFYYYYQDIYALLDDVFQMHLQEIKEKLPPEQHSLQEAMKVITGYLYDERRITSHVFKSLGYEKINDILFDSCMMYIPEFVKQSASGLSVCDGDLKLISTYCSITIAGLLTKWISQGMQTIPEETIDRFFEIVKGCARLALENAAALNRQDG